MKKIPADNSIYPLCIMAYLRGDWYASAAS